MVFRAFFSMQTGRFLQRQVIVGDTPVIAGFGVPEKSAVPA
jgi:hypothetical protein